MAACCWLLLFGIEAGIGLGDFSTCFFEPGIQLFAHVVDELGIFSSEVGLFAEVVGEVVEFIAIVFVVADEFPIAFSDDGGGFAALVSIMGVVPEERAVFDFVAFEKWDEADCHRRVVSVERIKSRPARGASDRSLCR